MTRINDPLPSGKGKTTVLQTGQASNTTTTVYTVPAGKVFYLTGFTGTTQFNDATTSGHNGQFLINDTLFMIHLSNYDVTITAPDHYTDTFSPSVPMPFVAGDTFKCSSSGAQITALFSIMGWTEDA